MIAAITYDNDLTRPWVVMVNSKEIHRASTNILCHHYICSHYKDGTLPVQEQNATDRGQMSSDAESYAKDLMSHFQYCDRQESSCTN
ncbi:hypothetical protein LC605_22865 [Nostoc sp. CHAB 5836]|uniref:hypothetical protein n=1 Tax=Nostoc sp. CHAB 5836 TaxID=2780404 RepID=UPI001E47BAE8|nr:hypothetical protein [Nostoc sp. CHAB 5836]MCC5617872.1 hypothetical protein [Nostoc sp. CHAB 5836]